MSVTRETVLAALARISLPDGGDLVSRDMIRALTIEAGQVRFVIEAASPDQARTLGTVEAAAQAAVRALPGVDAVQIVLTAHGPSAPPPNLKIGQHPTPQAAGPQPVAGIDRIIVIGSGKGGVGKSTVASNLAVALARQGRRVGLLDADIYGPSQPRMMGVSARPASPDGKTIIPLMAHGVTLMSIGLMLKEGEAVIWRGPMIMGALQQLLGQVAWGKLDVLLIDLPPGTGDIQLTLAQRVPVTGAVIVTTPQDIALIDARKGLKMFEKVGVPILGVVENMSLHICSQCGHEEPIFGTGGGQKMCNDYGVEFLGGLPLDIRIREETDAGKPTVVAEPESRIAEIYRAIARRVAVKVGDLAVDHSAKFPSIVIQNT